MLIQLQRIPPREKPFLVPQPSNDEPGVVAVDVTWGTIQPMLVAEGVQTIGEKEVLAHLAKGWPVIDSRTADFFVASTISSSQNIPYPEAEARLAELDRKRPSVFFCNGPQCGQSPTAIHALLEAGFPADKILYYRGGLHDWLTLGLPVVPSGG